LALGEEYLHAVERVVGAVRPRDHVDDFLRERHLGLRHAASHAALLHAVVVHQQDELVHVRQLRFRLFTRPSAQPSAY
jgi:hypothetical protein